MISVFLLKERIPKYLAGVRIFRNQFVLSLGFVHAKDETFLIPSNLSHVFRVSILGYAPCTFLIALPSFYLAMMPAVPKGFFFDIFPTRYVRI